MFSLEFGTDTSHLWLLNYGFSTMVDIFVKDMIKALIIAYLLMVVLPKCKEKWCKKKAEDDEDVQMES